MKTDITETDLDNVTHAAARALACYGINIQDNDNLMTDLNSVIANFLHEQANVAIIPDADNANADRIGTVTFDILSAGVTQVFEVVDDSYKPAGIVLGLRTRYLVTTTGFDGSPSTIDITETGKIVARILDSSIDGEYDDFQPERNI